MAKSITASVGMGGVNRSTDTITIQQLLNNVSPYDGGPSPPLVVDGICGPKTKAAIQNFQLKQFGWSGADGRVDPGQQTLERLNLFDRGVTPPPPPPPEPVGTDFFLIRMGSKKVVAGEDKDLFFLIVDIVNNRDAVYWLQPSGGRMTTEKPPAGTTFSGSGGRFQLNTARAVSKLDCPAAWFSREHNGLVTSRLVLFFSGQGVTIPMNHHLIGPGGVISPGTGGASVSTAIAGDLRFVEYR